MLAPPGGTSRPSASSLPRLLRRALAASALIFALLEFWRPYFFLTDDSLDGGLPFFTEIGQRLLHGQSPFISDHLFGGGYDLLRDPTFFAWHPLYLLVSLLAGTPFHLAIMDVIAFVLLMLATAGFATLAHHLRRELDLTVSDGWILFFTLSYVYSMIALTTGASWLTFLGNHSALPWLALGIVFKEWRRGVGLVLLFSLHQVLGGHLSPTLSSSIVLSLFAAGMSIARRSWQPLINWTAGYALALVIVLPLLVPMLHGFAQSVRAGGVTLEDMQANNIPAGEFLTSIFLGMALWIFALHGHPYTTYTLALGASAAVWCLLPAFGRESAYFSLRLSRFLSRRNDLELDARIAAKRPSWTRTEIVVFAMMIFIALLICRPVVITEIMMRLPLFRSMRWPFRELVQFQFFLHLFLVLRPSGLSVSARRASAFFGVVVFVVPMVLFPLPPTFNSMGWDRELVLGGGFDRYWAQVRPLLKPGDRVAVIIPLELYTDDRFEEPYSLLGTYNYAPLAGIVNAWGYSPTVPRDQVYTKTYAFYPFGAYHPSQKAALMEERPDLKFITLESLSPLKITLSSRDGPVIDLTPFVPVRKSIPPPHPHDLP